MANEPPDIDFILKTLDLSDKELHASLDDIAPPGAEKVILVVHDRIENLRQLMATANELTGFAVIVFPPNQKNQDRRLLDISDIIDRIRLQDIPEFVRIQAVEPTQPDVPSYPSAKQPLRGKPKRSQIAKKPPRYLAPRRN